MLLLPLDGILDRESQAKGAERKDRMDPPVAFLSPPMRLLFGFAITGSVNSSMTAIRAPVKRTNIIK